MTSQPSSASRPLRAGSVPYLVGRPLDGGLDHEPGVDLVRAVPARLIEQLRKGEVEVALVSSIELFRQPGYRYLDGLAIAGEGHVASVQVFLRKPIEEVQTLALDPSSRAAATLTRVLLAGRPQGAPEFVEVPLGEDPRAAGTDAWLRIGDAALREFCAEDAPPIWNPSQAWTEETGLPFIFAAWIVRPDARVEPHVEAFARAREYGLARTSELATRAAEEWQLPLDICQRYLGEECVYVPGPDMRAALRLFRDRAAALGLCSAENDPRPIPVPEADLTCRD